MPGSRREPLFGSILRVTAGPLLRSLFRIRVLGIENVPPGAAILSGNHVSYADPMLLWCVTPRHTHFMAKAELREHWFLRWGMPRVWAFPVRRHEVDRVALGVAADLLAAGELVGVFPEGTRVREEDADRDGEPSGQAFGGAAFIALRGGAPIVPVGIAGTERIRPRGSRFPRFPRVTISFGTPLDPSAYSGGGRKERVAAMTADVMEHIAAEVRRAREA